MYGTSTALYQQTQGHPAEQILQLCGEDITGVQCIAKYNNCIWVKANGMNLYKYNGAEWSKIDMTHAPSSTFLKIVPRNENEFWASSYAGAIKFDGINWSNYTINEGLSSDNVNDYAFENDSIWIATKKGIALMYNGSIYTIFNDSSLVSGYSNFNTIFIDKHGNKWAGSEKAVLKFNNSSFEYLYPTGIKEKIYSITEDPERNLWFCGSNAVSKYTFDNSRIETPVAEQNNLKIFQNPSQQEIYIDLLTNNLSDILEIYATNGAVIYQQKVQAVPIKLILGICLWECIW
jgi:ligand-binding sensor domain-containing protein